MTRPPHLTGLIAAPHTPFQEDGSVNYDAIPAQIAVLAKQPLTGAFLCGTTGEGFSLTVSERQQILETWTKLAPPSLKIIAHVAHHSIEDAKTLAAHAAAHGAYATACTAPSFLKPNTPAELADYCAPVAAAAPNLPFYYYHIPSLSGVTVKMQPFLQAAGSVIPNLVGIKYTHLDIMDFQQCQILDDGKYDLLWGVDEALLAGLALGAKGAVGSTYNYAANNYVEMIKAVAANQLSTAQYCARQSVRLVEILLEYGVLAAGKALMTLHGAPLGGVRRPLLPLPKEKQAELFKRVQNLGMLKQLNAGTA